MSNASTCIIGIGNTIRTDDGAGAYVCNLLEKEYLPAVTLMVVQQLDVSMAEELSKFDRVLFIDAAEGETSFSFQSLSDSNPSPQSLAHHVNPAMLAGLTNQLYKAATAFYICAIGASNFELGNNLSEKTTQHAKEAAAFIKGWINQQ